MKTHRCEGSLKARISIRYCDPYKTRFTEYNPKWYIFYHWTDMEWDVEGISPNCVIQYCPFCGIKLEIGED